MNNIKIQTSGFEIFRSVVAENLILELNDALERSYQIARNIQLKNGVQEATDGTVHHLLLYNEPVFMELLKFLCESDTYQYIKNFFGGNFILNSYGGLKNLPLKPSYVTNIHRDIRFFSGDFPLMLNLLIMLDDFTLENGATYVLEGSHKQADKPASDYFYNNSKRIVGERGDFLFFNSNLWHAAGQNETQNQRRAITITFTKPFMKQQMDYSRAIGYDNCEIMSESLQQILGYFSRTPSTLNEWYQKPENRFYRPGQD